MRQSRYRTKDEEITLYSLVYREVSHDCPAHLVVEEAGLRRTRGRSRRWAGWRDMGGHGTIGQREDQSMVNKQEKGMEQKH